MVCTFLKSCKTNEQKHRICSRDYPWSAKPTTLSIWPLTENVCRHMPCLESVVACERGRGEKARRGGKSSLKSLGGGAEWNLGQKEVVNVRRSEFKDESTTSASKNIIIQPRKCKRGDQSRKILWLGPVAGKHPQDFDVEMLRRHCAEQCWCLLLCDLWYKFLKGKDNTTA